MYQAIPDLEYFRLLTGDANKIPLLEAAMSLAKDRYPQLDLQDGLSRFDALAQKLADRCRDKSTEPARLRQTSQFFFKDCGFAGNTNNYYDPDNSFIHKVLETRRGIPISLALLYCELARSVGLDADGVAFPGHFLIKVKLHDGVVILDPFTGQSLSRDNLQERAGPYAAKLDGLLQAASSIQILIRMLNNLRTIYEQQNKPELLTKVMHRLEILHPNP
jgi:regulator of sirC expression with transglutaminase-like and TPR domain